MLVLSRKLNQRILIGQGIEVTVVAIRGNRVRLGISAPPELPILREELNEQMYRTPMPPQASQLQLQETR